MANKSSEQNTEFLKSKLYSFEAFDKYLKTFHTNLTTLQTHEKNNLRRSRHREKFMELEKCLAKEDP